MRLMFLWRLVIRFLKQLAQWFKLVFVLHRQTWLVFWSTIDRVNTLVWGRFAFLPSEISTILIWVVIWSRNLKNLRLYLSGEAGWLSHLWMQYFWIFICLATIFLVIIFSAHLLLNYNSYNMIRPNELSKHILGQSG